MNASERRGEMARALDDADRETRALLESLSDDDLKKRTAESNWTVGQLAGHIAQAPWGMRVLGQLSQDKSAAPPAPFGFLLHVANWWNTRGYNATSRQQLLDTWTSSFGKYREYVDSLPDSVLDNGGEVSGRGRLTVAEFVANAPLHTREHGETIRRTLGRL
jgi:hypothetical protein